MLSACTPFDFNQTLGRSGDFTSTTLNLARTGEQRAGQLRVVNELLQQPLQQQDAVRLAVLNSQALQALLAEHWAGLAQAAQSGRVANPVFNFERLVKADELEFGRLLSVGLFDLLSSLQRNRVANAQIEARQWQITADVLDQITAVRQAWVRAVAAKQSVVYARQVQTAAQASAELARRMQAAGNWSKLQAARQQAFHADAVGVVAAAQHAEVASRESLQRLIGLTEAQATRLQLPERLPDLPAMPRSAEQMASLASSNRIDVQMAKAQWHMAAKMQGLNFASSVTDIELGVRRDSVTDNVGSASHRGFEFSVRLPIFDSGDLKREAMNASTLAAANQLEATLRAAASHLRESYSAYRNAFELAQHYRQQVLPLRQTIAQESLLRYNGMLIGVFDLLADSRDQISTVLAAIDAEQQFWLNDASLQAALLGESQVGGISRQPENTATNPGH